MSASLTYSRRAWIVELLLLLAEGILIWMVAALAVAPFTSPSVPVSPALTIGFVVVAGGLPRLLHDRGIWLRSFGVVIAIAIVLSTLIAIKSISFPGYAWLDASWLRETGRSLIFEPSGADIVVWAPIGLSATIWWLTRFNTSPGLDRCRTMLQVAAVVTAVVAVSSITVATGPANRALTLGIIAVFTFVLVAMAIARQGNDATQGPRRLLTTVLLPTFAIVAIATILTSLVMFEGIHSPSGSLSLLEWVLDPVFQVLILLLTLLVMAISLPILWLLSLGNYRPVSMTGFGTNGETDPTQSMLDWQPAQPIRYVLASLALLLLFYGLTRFGLALTRRDADRLETGERSYGRGRRPGGWLDRLRRSFGRNADRDRLADLRNDPVWSHTIRIREIYADWLRYAQAHQLGRSVAETAPDLDSRAAPRLTTPAAVAALDELTEIYEGVRYAATPATPEQAERAASAWTRLRQSEPQRGPES
ncbi:MAG: DUF4129 domain-containing protein [Thermomicrobiales bacterium]|nr:DUF4129 domain-containing protein [Thermomicrobiales bacterium]MCO5221124.1 DUF4129 domain-containing protein [Thermomicrobiales bacterium]